MQVEFETKSYTDAEKMAEDYLTNANYFRNEKIV